MSKSAVFPIPRQGTKVNQSVSVDCVIFGFDDEGLKVLLIERGHGKNAPPKASGEEELALPGDLIFEDEDLDTAARRVLKNLTGLSDVYMEQFRSFGDPDRLKKPRDVEWLKSVRANPDARVITVAYYSLIRIESYNMTAGGFARNAKWTRVEEVTPLAFDHDQILVVAIEKLRERLYREPVGFELLPVKFSLAQLQSVYEIILGNQLDKRNFRRKILNAGFVKALDEHQEGVPHKPARLYAFDQQAFHRMDNEFFTL